MSFLPVNTGGKVYAAICVSYTKGETCTCTGGGRTWEAKNTDGEWVFPVPRAGEYTVAAGERSETVNVTKEGQGFLVNLASLRLIIAGEGYASGYSMTAAAGSVSVNSAKAGESAGSTKASRPLEPWQPEKIPRHSTKIRAKAMIFFILWYLLSKHRVR